HMALMVFSRVFDSRSVVRRSLLLAALGGAAMTGAVGCDRSASEADKKVEQSVAEALARMNGSEGDRTEAAKLLQKASGESAASVPDRLLAKEVLAQSELRQA